MRVAELSERLGVPYRDVRYVLEQGVLPEGVDQSPGRGEHRELTPAQAFWLAIVLSLKRNGVRVPLAGKVADLTRHAVRGTTQNLNWEYPFEPFFGMLQTENEWLVEIADLEFIRLLTTANPSVNGLYAFPWTEIADRRLADPQPTPIVVLRIDLARLAARLAG